jgi:hypothetical protein
LLNWEECFIQLAAFVNSAEDFAVLRELSTALSVALNGIASEVIK